MPARSKDCSRAGTVGALAGAAAEAVRLFLPALFPSWRFFDAIGPSPRLEIARLRAASDEPDHWAEARPLRRRLGLADCLGSFFWNPRWNETLFLVTCAEQAIRADFDPDDHGIREIRDRLRADLRADLGGEGDGAAPWFRFRILLLSRDGDTVRRDAVYTSPPYPVASSAADEGP